MSTNHTDFRLPDDDRVMRTHEAMVDFLKGRSPNVAIFDSLKLRYRGISLDNFDDSSDEDLYYYEDFDGYTSHVNNRYCGFARNFLERGLPKPPTAEEAAKTAKELVDEEEKHKSKSEKKKRKKMRQKERRRLEKVEQENKNKRHNNPAQVDPGPEKSKQADKDTNENTIESKTCSSVPQQTTKPQQTLDPVESSDSSEEEDVDAEVGELDMNSCFISNAASIVKRRMEQKTKQEKKSIQPNSKKQTDSEQITTTVSPNQVEDKEDLKAEEDQCDANYFITKSVEMAVLGNEYAKMGQMEMAVKSFTEAIKFNPKEYKLFGNRSFCYEKMHLYVKALTDAEIALSMDPCWIKGLFRKGKALVGLKRYNDARLTYDEVLKLDHTCADAAQEIMKIQLMQLMEMGFTKEQSSNALIIHGTMERALESLSGLAPILLSGENEFKSVHRPSRPPAKFPFRPLPQTQPFTSKPEVVPAQYTLELFPIWVGDLVSTITEEKLYDLFKTVGHVHNVRVLQMRYCAFVNYTQKEDCEKAISKFNGYRIDGTTLVVRYPDRIHTRLGVSRDASTERNSKQPDECFFWRTYGCIKGDRCTYKHIPENKGIDRK